MFYILIYLCIIKINVIFLKILDKIKPKYIIFLLIFNFNIILHLKFI